MGGVRRIPRRASRAHSLKSSPRTAARKEQRGLRHVRLPRHTVSAAFRPSMPSVKQHRSEGGRSMPAPFFLKGMPETLAAGLTPCPKAPCRSSDRASNSPSRRFLQGGDGFAQLLKKPSEPNLQGDGDHGIAYGGVLPKRSGRPICRPHRLH